MAGSWPLPGAMLVCLSARLSAHSVPRSSDKTGTLTLNKLTVDVSNVKAYEPHSIEEVRPRPRGGLRD